MIITKCSPKQHYNLAHGKEYMPLNYRYCKKPSTRIMGRWHQNAKKRNIAKLHPLQFFVNLLHLATVFADCGFFGPFASNTGLLEMLAFAVFAEDTLFLALFFETLQCLLDRFLFIYSHDNQTNITPLPSETLFILGFFAQRSVLT